jgi:hypothetical protein
MTMVSSGVLVRISTLKWIDVHAFDHCSNPTDQILRRHHFSYDHDPDTGVPRLTSVGISGRQETPEAQKFLSLGQFACGTATSGSGVLQYDLRQTLGIPPGGVPVQAGVGVTGPAGS